LFVPSHVATRSRARSPGAAAALAALALVACSGEGSPPGPSPLEAARRSLSLLGASSASWTAEQQCFSCHHQGLGTLALSMGAELGLEVDGALLTREREAVHRYAQKRIDRLLTNDGAGVSSRSLSLLALGSGERPRDLVTDLLAHYLATRQSAGGAWYSNEHRPPMEDSSVSATAWSLRALALYAAEGRAEETRTRVERAALWLEGVEPRDTEERAMRLLGLAWAGRPESELEPDAEALLAEQRSDGGWAQLPTLASDAYATGQALTVLHQVAGLRRDRPEWERGIAFLRDAQHDDGSWHVVTRRRIPGQPQVASGYPHEEDQFISYMAASWATMALVLDGSAGATRTLFGPPVARDGERAPYDRAVRGLVRTALTGSPAELRAALEAGADANELGPRGLRPLMLAVHDARKVELLLAGGADVNAVSEAGYTPVLFASMAGGAPGSLELLLAAGGTLECDVEDLSGPLFGAVSVGDGRALDALLAAGAAFAEDDLALALCYAATSGDVVLVRRLLELGADPDALALLDHTALMSAVIGGHLELVDALLGAGAALEVADPSGLTALAWAARVDPGHARILERLLAAGADPRTRSRSGNTPRDWAEHFGHAELERVLRAAVEAP